MTKTPSRNTRISIIGLLVLGFAAIGAIGYNIDRWLANGVAVKRIAETCAGFGTECKDAYISIAQIIGSPRNLLVSLAIVALGAALVKAVLVLASARRMAARYERNGEESPRLKRLLLGLNAEEMRVRIADDESVAAFTHGLLAPSICISKGLIDKLRDDELTALLAHEIGHVRRRDNLAIFAAIFIRDFLWPLPISHYLLGLFVREKEYAADDFAVELTAKPVELAEAIVSVARVTRGVTFSPAYATFFSGRASAKDRVQRLLDPKIKARPSISGLMLSIVASATIVLIVAGFAYAQPAIDANAVGGCCKGPDCVAKNHGCCK
ncbi:MAG: M56 family metallopeptidase [Actinobacteria bacterium]|nr:M56 family metallopeptidase [Actinomycetota bacterium]